MRFLIPVLLFFLVLTTARATTYDQAYGINFAFEEWEAPPTNISVTLTPPEWLTNGTPSYFWNYSTNPIALPSFYCTWYSGSWMSGLCNAGTMAWAQANMVGTNVSISPNTNAFPIIATVPDTFPSDGAPMIEWIGPDGIIQPRGSFLTGPYTNVFSPGPFFVNDVFYTDLGHIVVQSVKRYNSINVAQCTGSPGVDYNVTSANFWGSIELLNTACLPSTNASDYLKVIYYTTQPVNQLSIPRLIPSSSTNSAWRAVYSSSGVPFNTTQVSVTNTDGTVLITSSRADEYGAYGGLAAPNQPFMLYHQTSSTNTTGYYVLTATPTASAGGGFISFVAWYSGSLGSETFSTSSTNLTIQLGTPQSVIAVYSGTGPTNFPPSITSNPVAAVNVLIGASTNISATASGTTPLAYQWYFASSSVAAATNTTLQFPFAQPAQDGAYSMRVSNAYGSATSSICTLTVSNPVVMIGSGNYHLKIHR